MLISTDTASMTGAKKMVVLKAVCMIRAMKRFMEQFEISGPDQARIRGDAEVRMVMTVHAKKSRKRD